MSTNLQKKKIQESELILNSDGSVYHLNLLPHQIAKTIILVGDQKRVPVVSRYFDTVEHVKRTREFLTHTGHFKGKEISVISTGIGTDNIDIVLNELDALVNIDLKKRVAKKKLTQLSFLRIGTSGAIQKDIPIDSLLISEFGLGLDSLIHFYKQNNSKEEQNLIENLASHFKDSNLPTPYLTKVDKELFNRFSVGFEKGITATAPGFYAPQGRQIRAKSKHKNLIQILSSFYSNENRITNLEMETAGIYGLAKVLGHQAISFNAILANRANGTFSPKPKRTIKKLIESVLDKL